mgnify:FL=1
MKPTLALCMIVKASDDEAVLLRRALSTIAPFIDKIYITITGQNAECEKVCKEFNAEISHFEWINDFSAARNFNYKQAKEDYIMWIDADDLVKNAHLIPGTMEKIGTDNCVVDAIVMDYLFDFNELGFCTVRHLKTRIIKNDGCVEWVSPLHEDFKKNREIIAFYSEDIEIIHRKPQGGFEESKTRNMKIAEESLKKLPDDPRSYFLMANAHIGMNEPKEAIKYFGEFIRRSSSDEEIYLAYLRLADQFRAIWNPIKAIDFAMQALKVRPWYPDAYLSLGITYFEEGELEKAEEFALMGLRKAEEDTRYKTNMIVWNPRDYDFNPLLLLIKIYINQEKPREALKCMEQALKVMPGHPIEKLKKRIEKEIKELDKIEKLLIKAENIKDKGKLKKFLDSLPEDFRSHPGVSHFYNRNFVKVKSSGKDLVIFCTHTSGHWNPDVAQNKGIGGSEEAIINLAPRFQKLGWNVTVYANIGHREKYYDGVLWKPWWSWNYRDKQDVTIIWRHAKMLDFGINSDVVVVDSHDVMDYPYEFNQKRQNVLDRIFVKTKAHKEVIQHYSKVKIPDEKFAIIPNGLNVPDFEQNIEKDPYYLINTSSGDRSLGMILELLPEILNRLPEEIRKKVKFGWFYGWKVFDENRKSDPNAMEWKAKLVQKFNQLKEKGIVVGGGILSHGDIAKEYLKAGAYLYPTVFYEIHCISVAKAQAAGCLPITTDYAALNETNGKGIKINSMEEKSELLPLLDFGIRNPEAREKFIQAVVDYLMNPNIERSEMSKWSKENYDWDLVAKKWNEELTNLLQGKLSKRRN